MRVAHNRYARSVDSWQIFPNNRAPLTYFVLDLVYNLVFMLASEK
jgi:hypothetical protein